MTPETTALIGLGLGVIGNIIFLVIGFFKLSTKIAFGYGQLSTRVDTLEKANENTRRIDSLEKSVEENTKMLFNIGQLTQQVSALQIDVARMKDMLADAVGRGVFR